MKYSASSPTLPYLFVLSLDSCCIKYFDSSSDYLHVSQTCSQENSHALTRGLTIVVVLKLSAFTLMSHTRSAAVSSSNFQLIINNALDTCRKRTKSDLLTHPLATRLQACDTPAAILTIFREQIHQSRSSAELWLKWLDPTVKVLSPFSTAVGLGAAVGLVCLETCTHPRSAFSYSLGRYLIQ